MDLLLFSTQILLLKLLGSQMKVTTLRWEVLMFNLFLNHGTLVGFFFETYLPFL